MEEDSEDEDIWEEEEEEDEFEDSDEDWITGEDGIWYPKRFGVYEKDVLGVMDELNLLLPSIPEK